MSRRSLCLALPVVLGLAALPLAAHRLRPRELAPRPSAALATEASPHAVSSPRPEKARAGVRARYRLRAELVATVDGEERAAQRVEGTWTTTDRIDATEIALATTRLEVVGDAPPPAEEVAKPFVTRKKGGVLATIAFDPGASAKTRNLLTGLSTALQLSDAPSEASWTAEEEDPNGRYEAHYAREGRRVSRTRGRYLAVRGAEGLREREAGAFGSTERTEFMLDEHGVVSATIVLDQTVVSGKKMPTIEARTRISLARESVDEVPLVAAPELEARPVTAEVDRASIRRAELTRVAAGATPEIALADARAAAKLDPKAAASTHTRASALRRMAALAELDGSAAARLADSVRSDPSDAGLAGLVTGALAAARSPEATSALANLLTADLGLEARSLVLSGLAMAADPTSESVAALDGAMDQPLGAEAALALGAEANTLAGLGAQGPASDATEALVQRYLAATSEVDKQTYLAALGNTCSPDVLPLMQAAIYGKDFTLARTGTFGLRCIPGSDVDTLLDGLIQSGSTVAAQAIAAVGYRSPDLWRDRLTELAAALAGNPRLVDAIRAVLVRWQDLLVAPPT